MEENYEVMLGDAVAGRIQLLPDGLYIKCYCRCIGGQNRIYRLIACWEDGWENLGIPVPEGDALVLNKRIPAKRLQREGIAFLMLEADQDVGQAVAAHKKRQEPEKAEPEQNPDISENVPSQQHDEEEREQPAETKLPLDPQQPCPCLEILEQGRLLVEEAQTYLVLPSVPEEETQRESPTGQWSEPSTSE